jgi:hypothetical protein
VEAAPTRIKYGFEGGTVVKVDGVYHLMTTEMVDDPFPVATKLAHWTSKDRLHWTRVSTLFESSVDRTGQDPRASLWAPMPEYNEGEGRWNLFYVGYRSKPDTPTAWYADYEGRIYRAVSRAKGRSGIGGPYDDAGVILEPGPKSDSWEGLQGTDSFYPYKVKNTWYAFYGSAHTERLPVASWPVGLASSPSLAGPWTRRTALNPVKLEQVFSENPIVVRLGDGGYLAIYDCPGATGIGYSYSEDGIHWPSGRVLDVQPKGKGVWATEVRTPLSLIREDDGTYTLFYTGFRDNLFETGSRDKVPAALGLAIVRVEKK